ncbi:molybdopterin-dependent oxidoreductase [soil metagenome]
MMRAREPRGRADVHAATGVLLVWRMPPPPGVAAYTGQPAAVPADPAEGAEVLLAVWDDGSVTALNGHVDLGTGLRTALSQMAAEELDVPLDSVHMVLGSTTLAPNQGPTIASSSIQNHAMPMRRAAAQARAWLVSRAAGTLGVDESTLVTVDGVVSVAGSPDANVSYGALLDGQHIELHLDMETPLKSAADYRLIGTSAPRLDIPAKARGELTFVHDMRVPGMAHGRVVRPPYVGVDAGPFVGNSLLSVDESSIAHIPGILAVVVIRDFVGIVAEREEHADQAMRQLKVEWKPWPGMPGLDDLERAVGTNPSTRRLLLEKGDVTAAIGDGGVSMSRSYVWPYQLHASIGPSCALAQWHGEGEGQSLTVWAGTQSPHVLRHELAQLMGVADAAIDVVRMEAAGCYGRNCADDVAADAALLSRATRRPVRVQLSREQENAWEPKGAAQLMQVDGGLDADGGFAAYDFQTSYPSNGAPTLALLLTGTIDSAPHAYEMGDRTAVPPYDVPNLRVVAHDMAPILRASWLRGVSALPNSFAHESYVDELAAQAGIDPVQFRLRYLNDVRAAELLRATAAKAGWKPHTEPSMQAPEGDWLKGQGVAYARYVHSRFPGFGAASAAWVADVEVNRLSGEVHVSRIVVGHDAGMMVNPAGVQHQIHGNVLQTTSRALKEKVSVDKRGVVQNLEWGSYPILSFREVPVIEVVMMPRQDELPLGAGESSSVPGTAAIANAIFDATGVRLRQPPFTPEVVKAAMDAAREARGAAVAPVASPSSAPVPMALAESSLAERREANIAAWAELAPRRRRSWWSTIVAVSAGVVGLAGAIVGWRPAIAPVSMTSSAASVYTAATIERGRQLAATGDCVVCHTAPGGQPNAGGLAMQTPFGTVFSTNITPDSETGIGKWSFSAFQRAMREGISRDGHHLYPAFPYTAFTRTTDEDLTALYAYLMAQPAVASVVPETRLAFPFNVRPLMAFWNALNLDVGPVTTVPVAVREGVVNAAATQQTAEWLRGEYLVNGLGHCGACHTPRDAMGAEKSGASWMAGAMVDGWEAPSLTSLSRAPLPWTKDELFRYLRFGQAARHGVASGPMAEVVKQLATVPVADVQAMATYLASFQATGASAVATATTAADLVEQAARRADSINTPAQRMFVNACGACHHDGDGPMLLGQNLPLALNTNLHSDRPDNLLRVIMDGIREPATKDVGFMPAFKDALSNEQIAELAAFMRQRFAPDRKPWTGLEDAAAAIRGSR